MIYAITHGLPWIMSGLTLWMTFLQGNVHPKAWLIGLVNQLLWTVWIVTMEAWGLIPLNIGLWVLYSRNHLKWQSRSNAGEQGAVVAPSEPVTLKDPQAERPVEAVSRASAKFGPLLEIGHDYQYGGMDYRAHGVLIDLTPDQMNQFRAMIPPAIKEAETMWDRSPNNPANHAAQSLPLSESHTDLPVPGRGQ